jgi:hypothetical protein
MKDRTLFLTVLFDVLAIVFVAEWFGSKPADAVGSESPVADTEKAKPFEYFPSQFVAKPGEPYTEYPTF